MTPTLMTVEMATEVGSRLTAMRSTTGTGCEVSSSGGSFFGKKTSRTLSASEEKIEDPARLPCFHPRE